MAKFRYLILGVLYFLYGLSSFAQKREIDSLSSVIKHSNSPIFRADAYYQLSEYFSASDIDTIYYLCNKSISIIDENFNKDLPSATKNNYLRIKANALNNLGYFYREKGAVSMALEYFYKSLSIREQINDKKGIAESYSNLGYMCNNSGEIDKALSFHLKSLNIRESINDLKGQATSLNRIAVIYGQQAEAIRKKNGSIDVIENKTKQALNYHNRSLELRQRLNDKERLAESYNSIGMIHFVILKSLIDDGMTADTINIEKKKAKKYFEESFRIRNEISDKKGIAQSLNNLASYYLLNSDLTNAEQKGIKSLEISEKIGNPEQIRNSAYTLYKIYEKNNELKKAFEMFKLYILMKDSLQNSSYIQKQVQLEFQRKIEADSLTLIKQQNVIAANKLKDEQRFKWYLLIFIIIIILFVILFYNRYQIARKKNHIIRAQHQAVEEQKNQIVKKNAEIMSSINYAKRIQSTILPPDSKINHLLPDTFVIYLPKDIVSGDYYWLETNKKDPDTIFFAACDCTGHGVPGALVSLVCHNALTLAVTDLGLTLPSTILDISADIIIENLSKNNMADDEIKDGMDIALCSLNKKTGELNFAGANNPVWILKANNNFIEIKGNKQPVGKIENRKPFVNHTYQLEPGDVVYVFTDGYADQFGGELGKKFQRTRFRKLIQDITPLSLTEQKNTLLNTFEQYKGNLEQVDDVCIMAVRYIPE
ncbi:MAG: tetratricopeptide repeat protein [Bacteroidia bacterium]|nr:tetratricopeptide repeat protein [Bacteroidia bacterium]MCZ2249844.1 tetratricopeptide repeat protein [Bacteroidia bacterium]